MSDNTSPSPDLFDFDPGNPSPWRRSLSVVEYPENGNVMRHWVLRVFSITIRKDDCTAWWAVDFYNLAEVLRDGSETGSATSF